MSQLTKTLLFAAFIFSCWGISEEFATPAIYGVPALFLLSGLVVTLRENRREKEGYTREAPDPGCVRRYFRTEKSCVEEVATFEGYVESGLELKKEPPAWKEGI